MDEQLLTDIVSVLREIAADVRTMREKATKPTATIERPAKCQAYTAEDCARLNDEAAADVGGMSGARHLMCRGCGETVTIE